MIERKEVSYMIFKKRVLARTLLIEEYVVINFYQRTLEVGLSQYKSKFHERLFFLTYQNLTHIFDSFINFQLITMFSDI